MANQIVVSSGAKVRNLEGVLTGTSGVVSSVPLGAANGVATLDSGGKVPVSQLPSSVVTYLGTWNAATNTPTLVNGTGDAGDLYICNVAGTVNFGAGPIVFVVGDWVLYGSGTWQKSSGQNGTVTSVAASITGNSLGITGSPITTAGTLAFAFAGTNLQYVNGAGDLTTFPSLTGYIPYTGATSSIDLNAQSVVNISHLGINTTTVPTILLRAVGDNNSSSRIAMRGYSSNANSSSIRVTKFRGTVGAPQAPQSGDSLGKFELAGYGTTSSDGYPQASFEGLATENWGATARGSKVVLKITPNTTITQATALTINQDKSAVFENSITGTSIIKSGGTSSQFLKADGSVDSSTYLTTSSAASTYVPYTGATTNVDLGLQSLFAYDLYANGNGTNNANLYLKQGTASLLIQNGYSNILATGTKIGFQVATSAIAAYYADLQFSSLTAQRTYTLPDASGTLALTSDLTSYVTLATAQTITATKTFSAASKNESGILFNVGGSYTTIAGYNGIAGIANGLYVVIGTTALHGLYFNNSTNYGYTFPNASGTLALTSNLSSYLPLAGGTMTGPLILSNVASGGYGIQINNSLGAGFVALRESDDSYTLGMTSPTTTTVTIHANNDPSYINTTGNFGFGNASPSYRVDITGTLRNTTSAYFATSSGNVGIGNVSASYKLDVTGTGRFTSTVATTGVVFPATQTASADPNTLDDYEEGTWTAAFNSDTGSITMDNSFKTGRYTKIGRIVTIQLHARFTAISSPTGSLSVSGLPFTSASSNQNRTAGSIIFFDSSAPLFTSIVTYMSNNTSSFTIAGFNQTLLNAASYVKASSEIYIGLSYIVD